MKKSIVLSLIIFVITTTTSFASSYVNEGGKKSVNYTDHESVVIHISSKNEFRKAYMDAISKYHSYFTIILDNGTMSDTEAIAIIRDDMTHVAGVNTTERFITMESDKEFKLKIGYSTDAQERKIVDAWVKAWVKENINDGDSDKEKALKIYRAMYGFNYYSTDKTDTTDEYSKRFNAYSLLSIGKGVCMAYSDLFKRMATEAGLESKDIIGTVEHSGELHIWQLVKINGQWFHVDPTNAGTFEDETFFMKSGEWMSERVQWDAELYPDAQ